MDLTTLITIGGIAVFIAAAIIGVLLDNGIIGGNWRIVLKILKALQNSGDGSAANIFPKTTEEVVNTSVSVALAHGSDPSKVKKIADVANGLKDVDLHTKAGKIEAAKKVADIVGPDLVKSLKKKLFK